MPAQGAAAVLDHQRADMVLRQDLRAASASVALSAMPIMVPNPLC